MPTDEPRHYLSSLPDGARASLDRINQPGLAALRRYLDSGEALAFLGAGVSSPLYPLWSGVISGLVDAAADRMDERAVQTCRSMADANPDAVVEIVAQQLRGAYPEVLRELFRPARDPVSGCTWTPAHEAVVRCDFAGIITTNYDPGILDARMALRPRASSTGFASWTNDEALDRWRRDDIYGDDELPVLFAHGRHNDPDNIVLATSGYRRAYSGKLGRVLGRLIDTKHLVWIGFSFNDQRIAAIIREVGEASPPAIRLGSDPRHIAILSWDPDPGGGDPPAPEIIRDAMEVQHGCQVVFYPTPAGDHSALVDLLTEHADPAFPPRGEEPAEEAPVVLSSRPVLNVHWAHEPVPVDHFTGRSAELTRLDRWVADPEVRLIGVTAWGGAGKTTLVTHWLASREGPVAQRFDAVFAWSFYEEPSGETWASDILDWARTTLGFQPAHPHASLAAQVLELLIQRPILLVLDGLEVAQEGVAGAAFGRFLDGVLRDTLTGICLTSNESLVVLTSRFPFADLEQNDGSSARMLDVPPFTVTEGLELLRSSGADWLAIEERRSLVEAVDGHALALGALARALAGKPPTGDLERLRAELADAVRTDERVNHVLRFYAEQLTEGDRMLVAVVSLFQRAVGVRTVLAVAADSATASDLADWSATDIESAVRQRLAGLLSWHAGGEISAHPLVRDAFRGIALSGDVGEVIAEVSTQGLPQGLVRTRTDALRLVEVIELLVEAGHWSEADDLYRSRTANGGLWSWLPAARLGARGANAFVGTPARRTACQEHLGRRRLSFYLNDVALRSGELGEPRLALDHLVAADALDEEEDDRPNRSIGYSNMADQVMPMGDVDEALRLAEIAFRYADEPASDTEKMIACSSWSEALLLGGDTIGAEEKALMATGAEHALTGQPPCSVRADVWARLFLRTGRVEAARTISALNREISLGEGWNEDVARCDRVRAVCALIEGDHVAAAQLADDAATVCRDGDMLIELLDALIVQALVRVHQGSAHDAHRIATQAIGLAGPRGLVPCLATALALRSRARALYDRDEDQLEPARDDADHALRLSTRTHRLPWMELDALLAHAAIDAVEGEDHGWQAKATALWRQLVPEDLDPDPLRTSGGERS